jgi:hypothetical protein
VGDSAAAAPRKCPLLFSAVSVAMAVLASVL